MLNPSTDTPTISPSHLTSPSTLSPFLPNTRIQFAWDSTCLNAIKTCPRLYQYTILDGYIPRDESIHLRFGIEYHAALELYDRLIVENPDRDAALLSVIRSVLTRTHDWTPDPDTRAGKYKNRDTLVGLVVDYLDRFRDDPTATYIKADGVPAVELSFRFPLEHGPRHSSYIEGGLDLMSGEGAYRVYEQPYLLCGHLDRVVLLADQLMIMDRKTTTTTLSPHYFAQYEPNNQMTLYTLAGRIILDAPIRGVLIDAAQILLDKPNAFARGFTYRTEDQLTEWLADLSTTLAAAETYAITSYWPMNDTSCDKFGGCRFRGICSKSPAVRDRFLAADFHQLPEAERWNPLKAR